MAASAVERREQLIYFTVREMADLLRKTVGAIYAMNARGQLPGVVRIGRAVRFHRQSVLDWLDRKTAPSPKEWR